MVAVAKQKTIDPGFGKRLRELREEKGLTQAALGERAGMLGHAVARLEHGDREPTWGTLLKIADALGVKLDDFRLPIIDAEPDRPKGKRK